VERPPPSVSTDSAWSRLAHGAMGTHERDAPRQARIGRPQTGCQTIRNDSRLILEAATASVWWLIAETGRFLSFSLGAYCCAGISIRHRAWEPKISCGAGRTRAEPRGAPHGRDRNIGRRARASQTSPHAAEFPRRRLPPRTRTIATPRRADVERARGAGRRPRRDAQNQIAPPGCAPGAAADSVSSRRAPARAAPTSNARPPDWLASARAPRQRRPTRTDERRSGIPTPASSSP
jgi:hypothetical protein